MPKSRLMWPTRKELHQRHALMDEMMEKRGVNVLEALSVDGGLAFIEARAKCRYCLNEGVCRRWLAGDGHHGPEEFCPNVGFFGSVPVKED